MQRVRRQRLMPRARIETSPIFNGNDNVNLPNSYPAASTTSGHGRRQRDHCILDAPIQAIWVLRQTATAAKCCSSWAIMPAVIRNRAAISTLACGRKTKRYACLTDQYGITSQDLSDFERHFVATTCSPFSRRFSRQFAAGPSIPSARRRIE